jgi:cytoskeleton protein RodZ
VNETSGANEQPELTVAQVVARELPGPQLRAVREKMGLTVGDVAQSIKFSPRQIEALERDDLGALPPGPTFMRGFIRSYAKLLRIDAEPLLDLLPREVPVETSELAPPERLGTRLPMPGHKRGWMPVVAIAALTVALAALAVHYFYRGEPKPSSTRQSPVAAIELAAAPASVTPPSTAVVPTAPVPSNVAPTEPVPANPVTASISDAPAVAKAPPASPTRDAPVRAHEHQLIFMFDDKSWVEVKDASQAIIFSQINMAGTRQVVSGSPPFDLVIGNASLVHLQYDGHPVDLAPDTRAEVARLTLQ